MDPLAYSQPIPRKERIVLVEGKDDALTMEAIARMDRVEGQIQFLCYRPTGELGDFLDTLVKASGFEKVVRIGLSRDADSNTGSARQSLEAAWTRSKATIASFGGRVPEVSYFVLPNNKEPGRLENLCLDSAAFPEILHCAEEAHNCAVRVAKFALDREKSIVAAYLAMMGRPGIQIGTGAQTGAWNLLSTAFDPLRQFIRELSA